MVGAEPAPLAEPSGPLLICEGWATGDSLHMATGYRVVAAMDAGNLLPVAGALRARFLAADIVLVADNDVKPDRDGNPGVEAARKVALAVDGRLAVPDRGKMDIGATADLIAARERLCKALRVTEPGPLRPGLLEAVGLTPDDCRHAAMLERRRMRDAGLRLGMSPVERRKRIEAVMPPAGEPWAPPGRCATRWLILAVALENGHDAAGAELVHEMTEAGSVRALRLRWRSLMRTGWAAQAPILHPDATLRPELVQSYLPRIDIGTAVAARQPMSASAR